MAMAPLGFDEAALCPAHGMAEPSVACLKVRAPAGFDASGPIAPELLEEAASRHEAVRPGNRAAIQDGSGGHVIVAERRRAHAGANMHEVAGGYAASCTSALPPPPSSL